MKLAAYHGRMLGGGSISLFHFRGIKVTVDWSWFIVLFLVILWMNGFFEDLLGESGTTPFLLAVLSAVGFFGSILLHEFGHAVVAMRNGIGISSIQLWIFGGMARMDREADSPGTELKVALAGPAVTAAIVVVLTAIGIGAAGWTEFREAALREVQSGASGLMALLAWLAAINLFVLIFNLLPAFPMDGGRVLRGLLATRLGAVQATDVSAAIGQGFAFVFFLLGLLGGNLILALIAVFIFFGASGEGQMVRQREMARGLTVSDVMGDRRRIETVTPHHTFGQVLDLVLHGYQEDFPVVEEDGSLVGMLTRGEIFSAARSPDGGRLVREMMITEVPTISPEADLSSDGNRILHESGLRAVPVMKGSELVGMLTVDDIGQASLLKREQLSARTP
jgi:Zn-dependent protease/CBS domain-containing protein